MKVKNIICRAGWYALIILVIAIARYAFAGGLNPPKTFSEEELYSIATKDCHKLTAQRMGVEENHPAVSAFCNCYGTTIASKYKGMPQKEVMQHEHEFMDIGKQCAADIKSQYQQGGEQ